MSSDRPDQPAPSTGPADRDETVSMDKGRQAAGYDPSAWSSPAPQVGAQQPYPQGQYGQDQYGQPQGQYGHDQYGQAQAPYGQAQYGQGQYGQGQYGQQPYGGQGATPYGQAQYAQPAYSQPGAYGQPGADPAAYGQYPQGAYAQPYPVPRGTNTLSIVALIFAFVFPLVGLILGFVARGHIKRTGEEGDGLALAAIIIGGIFTLLAVAFFVFFGAIFAAAASSVPTTY